MASSNPVLCGSIAGRPGRFGVAMHNAAYRALGLDYAYVAFGTDDTAGALAAMRALGIRGLGVTTPHKERIVALLDEIDQTAAVIGAVNTVLNEDGRLKGYNVDWIGAVRAFEERLTLDGRDAVVIGAGGGARAIIYGLIQAGARVTVYNRGETRGREVAARFAVRYGGPPEAVGDAGPYDLLAHVTPVGFHDADAMALPAAALRPGAVVFDAVAQPPRTRLLREAEALGCATIAGTRMQLHQAAHQFALYTGRMPDPDVMEKALSRALLSIEEKSDS